MKSLAVLLAGTALAISANAATVSFNFTNAFQTTEISQTGNLGLFDSTLGALTGVSLSFNGGSTTTLSLKNSAQQSQTTTATGTTALNFGSSLSPLNTIIFANNPVVSLSATTGAVTLAPNVTQSFGPLLGNQTITWTEATQLSSIVNSFANAGGGIFAVSCTSLSGFSVVGGGGNISSVQSTEAGCGASIQYTYGERPPEQVPEPASLALVGLALAGVAFVRKAKKA